MMSEHSHHHGHSHHNIQNFDKAFFWGIGLNLFFVVVEVIAGYVSNSMSLLADAGHNFSDVLGLILAFIGYRLNQTQPLDHFTFGYKKFSLVTGFFNSVLLTGAVIYLGYESIHRFFNPEETKIGIMFVTALIGIGINFFSALAFRSHGHDVNIKSAYLHLMADAIISLGVVIASMIIYWTGYFQIDALIAFVISLIILFSSVKLLKESFLLLVGQVPAHIKTSEVKQFILNFNSDIASVHFLKIWALSSSETYLICHLIVKTEKHPGNQFIHDLSHQIEEKFNIHSSTFQIEINDGRKACHSNEGEIKKY